MPTRKTITKRAKSIGERVSRVATGVVQQTVAGAESAVESVKEFVQDHT
jgi:hypothetical protein